MVEGTNDVTTVKLITLSSSGQAGYMQGKRQLSRAMESQQSDPDSVSNCSIAAMTHTQNQSFADSNIPMLPLSLPPPLKLVASSCPCTVLTVT